MVCVAPPEAPLRVGAWGYAVVALVILISQSSLLSLSSVLFATSLTEQYLTSSPAIVLLVVCLWKVHKSGSAAKRAELDEYYKEQLAFVPSPISLIYLTTRTNSLSRFHPLRYRTSILSLQSAVLSLPPLHPHQPMKSLPPPPPTTKRTTSRSKSHHSMRNPYDTDTDTRPRPRVYRSGSFSSEDDEEKKDEMEREGERYDPAHLAYEYVERRRGGGYEEWDEVDLHPHRRD